MFESIAFADLSGPHALVFAKFQDLDLPEKVLKHPAGAAAASAVQRGEFSGAVGNIAEAFISVEASEPTGKRGKDGKKANAEAGSSGTQRVLVVGLGKSATFGANDLRAAAAAVVRRLGTAKETAVGVHVATTLEETKLKQAVDLRQAGRCFGEGMGLLTWNNQQFKGKATDRAKRTLLTADVRSKVFRKGVEHGVSLADCVNFARTLSETPPNIATPRFMADQCKAVAKESGGRVKVTVFEGKDLETERLTGHDNVGKASENKPCMIRMEYTPANARKHARAVVLIGKTICYDTGGLSLKINNGMVGMKRDKDGGCAVIGAMRAIATIIRPDVPVVALLCAAENSISDEAYRPDDILTYRNGVTVEITNTDAEGRLVLADALCWACEKENPACIVDLATLTGGVVTALGSTFCGLFCEDDGLRARVEKAAGTSGERVWRLPMHAEYKDMMKSPVADILNSNPNRKAHPIQGAAFLSYFVDEKTPWCHLDIAGVHATESDSGPFVKGPTGWGVRLLADLLEAY
ncbi:MAG: leucyl aminopeptidase family protein [Phycisphaerales bacterium]